MKFTLSKGIELISSTPNEFDHSVGYHDIKPFNKGNDDILLVHRYPKNTIGPKKIYLLISVHGIIKKIYLIKLVTQHLGVGNRDPDSNG